MRVESDLLDPEVVVAEDQPSRARVAEAEEVVGRNLEAEGEADAEFLLHNYAKEFFFCNQKVTDGICCKLINFTWRWRRRWRRWRPIHRRQESSGGPAAITRR